MPDAVGNRSIDNRPLRSSTAHAWFVEAAAVHHKLSSLLNPTRIHEHGLLWQAVEGFLDLDARHARQLAVGEDGS